MFGRLTVEIKIFLSLEKLQVDLKENMKQNQALMEETSVKEADIAAGKLEISRLSSEVTCLCKERDDIRIQYDDVVNSNESVQNELGQCAFDYIIWFKIEFKVPRCIQKSCKSI